MIGSTVTSPQRLQDLDPITPVTLVVAPAGFGKSTVLRAWHGRTTERSAWVRLGSLLNPRSGLDCGSALLEAAIAIGADPAASRALGDLLCPDGSALGEEFLRGLATVISAVDARWRLFVDDLHELAPMQVDELGSLIAHIGSERHRFVVASRVMPAWPTQRWRLDDFATVVTARQLELTQAEVVSAIASDFGERSTDVAAMSGGWPAAVQVMRWHASESPGLFSERVINDISEYVMAEVIPTLPAEQVEILTHLAVLEPFPISVGVAVADHPDVERVLRDTMSRTALVDFAEDGSVVIHSTVKVALLRALQRDEPEAEAALHVRAAEAWLAQPPTVEAFAHAVNHYLAASAWDLALQALRQRWTEVEADSRLDRLVDWLDQIPSALWRQDPDLSPMYVLANLRLGLSTHAHNVARSIKAQGDEDTYAVARLAFAATVGWDTDPAEAISICAESRPRLQSMDAVAGPRHFAVFPGVTNYSLAVDIATSQALTMCGSFTEAVQAYSALLGKTSVVSPATQIVSWGSLGASLAFLGELDEAEGWLDAAAQLATEQEFAYHFSTIPTRIGLAVARAFRGDRQGALPLLELAATVSRSSRCLNFLHACDLVAVLCHVDEKYVESVDPPLVVRPLQISEQFRRASAARRDSRLGRQVNAVMRLQGAVPHELTTAHWTEVITASRGRAAAANWLSTLPEARSASGMVTRMLCEATVVPGAAEAAERAEAAAELAEAKGLHGVFSDAPTQLWRRPAIADARSPLLLAAVQRVSLEQEADRLRLTDREQELLRLLPLELSLAELADRMFLSVHTLKWHRANLYRKLGVRSRREAISKAEELEAL